MGCYFKPWRRKFGVLTLGMACVFMAGWVRSRSGWDALEFFRGSFAIQSDDGNLLLARIVLNPSGRELKWSAIPGHYWRGPDPNNPWQPIPFGQNKIDWSFQWNGFEIGDVLTTPVTGPSQTWMQFWQVPYWSIVIPLTLLSTWLLLSKSGKSVATTTTEPVPVQGI